MRRNVHCAEYSLEELKRTWVGNVKLVVWKQGVTGCDAAGSGWGPEPYRTVNGRRVSERLRASEGALFSAQSVISFNLKQQTILQILRETV